MYKVFVEYKVSPERRDTYIAFMKSMQACYPQMELLEATDQPLLFLEIWQVSTEEDYVAFKQERIRFNHEEWSTTYPWIVGGVDKVNIWRFHHST